MPFAITIKNVNSLKIFFTAIFIILSNPDTKRARRKKPASKSYLQNAKKYAFGKIRGTNWKVALLKQKSRKNPIVMGFYSFYFPRFCYDPFLRFCHVSCLGDDRCMDGFSGSRVYYYGNDPYRYPDDLFRKKSLIIRQNRFHVLI